MTQFNTWRAATLMIVALFATTACSKKADETVVATDSLAMGGPPVTSPLRVSAVETGKALEADKSIDDDMKDFGARDTVYVAVKTEGTGTGTLAAKWTFQDGQTVGQSSQSIAPTGDAWHEFHVRKASAWPKGNYKVEITLNGSPAGSKDFTVK